MAVTSQKGLTKDAIAKQLKKHGFITWRIFSPVTRMYALLIIACNRFNPFKPYLAYLYFSNELWRLTKFKSVRTKAHQNSARVAVDAQARYVAARQYDDKCPCCRQTWNAEERFRDRDYEWESLNLKAEDFEQKAVELLSHVS